MATILSHSESRRLYSWWWNSHISSKNSKWLQENLAEIDGKVKAMIRIIEEDADSFAKRAEMYYKKRPELMKLVEEFYRAYRALAERYDHATGVLRQAHRTMAVVFPNQIPLELSDDSASGFLASDVEPVNPEMLELFNSDASVVPSLYDAMKMSGVFVEETDLNFQDGGKDSKLESLREEISRLSKENMEFRNQITLELERAYKAETEVDQLRDDYSKERSEKEDALSRYDESLTRISFLEVEIGRIQEDLKRLNDEVLKEAESLSKSKEQILLLEKANKSLQLELEKVEQLKREQQEELNMKVEELAKLETSLQDEHIRCVKNEMAVQSIEKKYAESQEDMRIALEKLKEVESTKLSLEEELQKVMEENTRMNKQKLSSTLKIIDLQDEIIVLRELKGKLQDEVKSCREEKELLYQELCQLKEDKNNLEQAHHVLEEQIQEAAVQNKFLRETIKEHESEKAYYLQNLEQSEKRYCEAQEEVRGLHEKLKEIELIKLSLREELQKIHGENERLKEEKLSSILRMIDLQDEMICLKNLKGKLEDELEIRREEKKVFHLELHQLKENKISLEERHLVQKEQIEAVTAEMESLKAIIKNLRDQNDELNETIEKQENEKVVYLEKLEQFQQQYSESQEETRSVHKKLQEVELIKFSLEEELEKIRQENGRLNEQKLSSTIKIINLQDEIIFLKSSKEKLEDEMRVCGGEKEILHLELSQLKEDTNNSEHRHKMLQGQIQAVTLEMESLQAMVKQLKDGNDDLNEVIKKHQHEKVLYLQNMKHTQAMSERNKILENSLADANVELKEIRKKVKILEDSGENLRNRISLDQTEKAVLVSHMDAATRNIEKLLCKNTFLENSLSNAKVELDNLKANLKLLDESCQSLRDEKSALLSEKGIVVSKVESISWSLRNLEKSYNELEGKCSNLEIEKAPVLRQIAELQELLRLEKEKHKALIHSSENQLGALEKQIYHLEKQCWERQQELEAEQQSVMNAQLEIFILQQCLCNTKEENLSQSVELQKQKEMIKCAEKLIAELKQECHIKEKKVTSSAKQREKVREWILRIIKILKVDLKYVALDDVKDEFLLQLFFCEVRHLLKSISDAHDEKQILILEKSVVVTLLEQFGLYVADLRAEVMVLDQESKLKEEEFKFLRDKNDEILEMNNQLKEKLQVGNQREELLKAEVDILFGQLSQLQELHRTLQTENSKMFEEKKILSDKLHELRRKNGKLEEENNAILSEIMTLDYLSVALKNYLAEKGLELQILTDERDFLCKAQNELVQEITLVNKKVEVLQLENKQLKVPFTNLEDCRRFLSRLHEDLNMARNVINVCEQLNLHSQTGKNEDLPEEKKQAQISQLSNLHQCLEDTKMGKKVFTLSEDHETQRKELACLHQTNETMKLEIEKMKTDGDKLLQNKEENLNSDLRKSTDEIKSPEEETLLLLNDIHCATISAKLFRQKVIELILTCESIERSAMLHRKALHEEIMLKDASVNELNEKVKALEIDNRRLKEELKAYMSLLGTFWDDITILEEQALSLGKKHPSPNNPGKQCLMQDKEGGCAHKKSEKLTQTYGARLQPGILELQDLQTKIRALQKLVRDTRSLLELERLDSNASIEAAWKEIETLRSKDNLHSDGRKIKYERIMRDIKLDVVLNSSQQTNNIHYHGARKRANANSTSDQKLELWGTTTEGASSNQKEKSPFLIEEHSAADHQIEEVEGSHPSSEPVSEKELGVDKLELPMKAESQQEWNQRIMERLSSDAQRLSALTASLQETNKNVEALEKINNPKTLDLEVVKVQLKEAETTISKLVDINSKLTKKAGDLSDTCNQIGEKKDAGNRSRRQILDRVDKMSEKIGKLEFDFQKIQYTLQKLEEEHINKTKVVGKSGMLLKEYIYGRKDNRRKKRGSCGCMKPKTKGD
ncbi:hypothetical protein Cni_G08147 [Canna indica]|uniref:NAB domain-containing protein n=1 Tax=Canna indica TaxID=4628 RepID=A0AAQ3Q5G5_9LILI|nr:hypothetical protein Cni_G08147 [Canna indica]